MTDATRQPDLFGGLHPVEDHPGGRPARADSNDADLLHTVAANAVRAGYVLVGASERVYARGNGADPTDVVRVPRYEEDAVHQLVRRRCLTLGSLVHNLTCGAATLTGTPLLVPKHTRVAVGRWEARNRPPRTGTGAGTGPPDTDAGSTTAQAQNGGSGRGAGRALWCPECGQPAQARPPRRWTTANGPRPDHSHRDGQPLCLVVTATGYRPAWPTTRRPR